MRWMIPILLALAAQTATAQEFPQANAALALVEECERRTRLGDCSSETTSWAEALGLAMGGDASRVTSICTLPLAQSAKDRCKSLDSFQFGMDMTKEVEWSRECIKDARPARECQENILRRYGTLLAKHGGSLPVPIEPGAPGPPEDFLMAQMLADVVKLYGHPCSSISSFLLDERRLVCNHGQQTYSLGNRNGLIAVMVE